MIISRCITICLLTSGVLAGCGGGGSGGSDSGSTVSDASETTSSGKATVAANPVEMSAGCEVDQYQADLIELINIARSEAQMCGDDHYEATAPVTYSCTLEGAARTHSVDMETHNFFSHTGSDGLTVGNRVTATGYEWSIVGENIAAGYDSPASVTAGWLASPGHCRNIMDPRFKEFAAVRIDSTSASNDYSNYWTSVYGTPR